MNVKEFWRQVHLGKVKRGDKITTKFFNGDEDTVEVIRIVSEKSVSPNDPHVRDNDLCIEAIGDNFGRKNQEVAIWQSSERDFGQTYSVSKA